MAVEIVADSARCHSLRFPSRRRTREPTAIEDHHVTSE